MLTAPKDPEDSPTGCRGSATFVSIVTPSYNQAAFIWATIESVRQQRPEYPHIEHLIIDGGSTDGTIELLAQQDDAKWISEADAGQADAINKGLRLSRGAILAYLNTDDVYELSAVKRVVEHFERNPAILAVYGLCRIIDQNDRQIGVLDPPPFKLKDFLRLGASFIPQPTFFFRRSAWELVGEFDVTLKHAMDYDFIARIGREGGIQRLPYILASFRVHDASKTSTDLARQRRESVLIQQRYLSESLWRSRLGLVGYRIRRLATRPLGRFHPLSVCPGSLRDEWD